jgi:hypothetical protein
MIAPDQTRCRCGVLLASCADCRGWLIDNSPRIALGWEWWFIRTIERGFDIAGTQIADTAELEDLGVYLARRFLG